MERGRERVGDHAGALGRNTQSRAKVLPNRSKGQVQQTPNRRHGACFVSGTVLGTQQAMVIKTEYWFSNRLGFWLRRTAGKENPT